MAKSKKLKSSKKGGKLFQNLKKLIKEFLQGKGDKQLSALEIREKLSLPQQHQEIVEQVLQELMQSDEIELSQGGYKKAGSKEQLARGTLRMNARGGFGFLEPDDPEKYPQDIFIPRHLTQGAVEGDRVEVQVNPIWSSPKGPDGKVIQILSREHRQLAGVVLAIDLDDAIVFSPVLGIGQRILVEISPKRPLRVGDRILMKVEEWGSKERETICSFEKYLGHISDPGADIQATIAEFNLKTAFSKQALEEAKAFGDRISLKEIAGREDLRELECFTIDPDTAKDFDDAISLSKDEKGQFHLGVHIADVSHYVRSGSALDIEARGRCNSTYFPAFCLPMLPEELSNHLCSLRQGVNRLTVSVLAILDPKGGVLSYRIVRSVIKSARRFTYREAKAVLDGKKRSQHLPTLRLMVELCALLKHKRYERGSIEFAVPELYVVVDEKGVPQKTDLIEYDITHQLVEEFMLKANELVAAHLSGLGKNLTYRVHGEPAEDSMREFSFLAAAFGFHLPHQPTSRDLQEFFERARETPYAQHLTTSYIRKMRLAEYSSENIGHYGLSLSHYCHFTSPIRRYVDLVVHRLLFGEKDEKTELTAIAKHCSDQERVSAKAEQRIVLLKKLRLLEKMSEEEPGREFEGMITKIKSFGFFFEMSELMLEGFIHISEIGDDYFVFDEERMVLEGADTGKTYRSGDSIRVLLNSVDLLTLETRWHLIADLPKKRVFSHKKSFKSNLLNQNTKRKKRKR